MRVTSRRLTRSIVTIAMTLTINMMLLAANTGAVNARASLIVLDGQFSDWTGHMNITDPTGDASHSSADITAFYWANNPDDTTCYWMMERMSSSLPVGYAVYLDANNNGNFSEHVDRVILVKYRPKSSNSKVSVAIRYPDTWKKLSTSNNNDWGESISEGGRRVEFRASFQDLGISIGHTIRMYAISYVNHDGEEEEEEEDEGPPTPADRVPDTGDVQCAPVPILGYPLLAVVVVGGVIAIWYFKGRRTWRSA